MTAMTPLGASNTEIIGGSAFLYYGPRRLLMRRRVAPGVVLAVNEAKGVVHVRTFRWGSDTSVPLPLDIAHLPLAVTSLVDSIAALPAEARKQVDLPSSVFEWNERNKEGEVGFFTVPLWEAERMAWSTAREAEPQISPKSAWIEYAFPKRGRDGRFSKVEVAVWRRDEAITTPAKADHD